MNIVSCTQVNDLNCWYTMESNMEVLKMFEYNLGFKLCNNFEVLPNKSGIKVLSGLRKSFCNYCLLHEYAPWHLFKCGGVINRVHCNVGV